MAGWKFFIDGIKVDEPIGWDAVEFMAKRLEFHGIDQPFTTDISFIGKGAKILKSYFDSGFINDNIPFQITSNQIVNGLPYSFDGYINMAIYSEVNTCDTQGWQITVGIIEDPFRENFLTRQDVEIDLLTLKNLDQDDIDPLVLTEVRLHSQQLYLQGIARNLADESVVIFKSSGDPLELSYVMPYFWQNSDFKGQFGNTFDRRETRRSDFNAIFVNNGTEARNIRAKGKGSYSVNPASITGSGGDISFQIFAKVFEVGDYGVGTLYTGLFTTPLVPVLTTSTGEFTFDFTFPVPVDYGIVIQWGYSDSSTYTQIETTVSFPIGIELEFSEFSTATASLCNGLYVYDFLYRLLEIITGNSNPLVSDYFALGSGLMWNNFITTGLYIRNGQLLEETNPQITTTFKKFFEDLSRIFNLGWAFEWSEYYQQYQIRIEPMEYFYNNGIKIGDFEKVSGIKQYALSEKLVNNFRIGFTDQWKNIAVSGIFEPHTYRSYFTPNKSRSGEKTVEDLRSNIICSGYAIEFSRRLQFLRDDSGSSDRPNDYNLFLIWLNRESVTIDPIEETGYEVIGETGSVTFLPGKVSVGSDLAGTTNSPIESVYNILHTPARIAARFWKLLGMHTYGLPDAKAALFFQSGEYYTTLESEINNTYFPTASQEIQGTVSESTNISEAILAEGLNQYLFKPIGFDCSFPQSLCSFQTMANL